MATIKQFKQLNNYLGSLLKLSLSNNFWINPMCLLMLKANALLPCPVLPALLFEYLCILCPLI